MKITKKQLEQLIESVLKERALHEAPVSNMNPEARFKRWDSLHRLPKDKKPKVEKLFDALTNLDDKLRDQGIIISYGKAFQMMDKGVSTPEELEALILALQDNIEKEKHKLSKISFKLEKILDRF